MTNTVLDLLHTRRSVKAGNLIEPGPDASQLEAILRAATRVPDHGKLTPWYIQVLHKPGQAKLGDFLASLFASEIAEANDKQIAFERDRPQRAPLLLVVTYKPLIPHKIPEVEQILSAGAVCTHILMAAHAQGFAAQWLSEWPAYREEVRRFLGHDGVHDQIAGFIFIGTPSEPPQERARPTLDDVTSVFE